MDRRSKIYTYFYGRNTVLQQFIILLGGFIVMMSLLLSRPLGGDIAEIIMVLGILVAIVGVIWILYKKFSFNKVGEREYDEELADCSARAKQKGMEKLNIISDQIERVEPVVLNGIGQPEGTNALAPKNAMQMAFGSFFVKLLALDKFILGLIGTVVYYLITMTLADEIDKDVMPIVMTILGLGIFAYILYKFYGKYEVESYVSPRVFKRLDRFVPNFISKLGSDDNIRVSLPSITVYMFGDEQLYVYYQYIDIVTGKIFFEGVNEYFYEDIVGVTSTQEIKKIYKRCGFMKLFLKDIDYLKESICVVTSGCTHKESYIVDIGKSLLDTSFTGMRNLIRQKKAE